MENIHIYYDDKENPKNNIEDNTSPSFNSKRKIKSDNRLETHEEINFENKVVKMFKRNKFKLSNEFNQKNSEIFLKDKDECMKEEDLDDTIPHKKKKHLDFSRIKKNYNKINSFYSIESSNYVKEIVDLLK